MYSLAGIPKPDTSHLTNADIADWIGPRVGDLVHCGPGRTRFTVLSISDGWVKLAYPHGLGVLYRKADALALVQAAPVQPSNILPFESDVPATRRTLLKRLKSGDVLVNYGGERLTVRVVWCHRRVVVQRNDHDHHYILWVTDARGRYRQLSLSADWSVLVEVVA